jgi:dienelactone hydrolase
VIWNYDAYGFKSGRSIQCCDDLAKKGFLVVMPDYLRGKTYRESDAKTLVFADYVRKYTDWNGVFKKDVSEKVLPYCKNKLGAKYFSTVNTCWGSYVGLRTAADFTEIVATVSMHPSHPILMSICNDDEGIILTKMNKKKHLFMPAANDHEHVREGGMARKVLKDRLQVLEFPSQMHGWTVRGNETVEAARKEALELTSEFLKANMIPSEDPLIPVKRRISSSSAQSPDQVSNISVVSDNNKTLIKV